MLFNNRRQAIYRLSYIKLLSIDADKYNVNSHNFLMSLMSLMICLIEFKFYLNFWYLPCFEFEAAFVQCGLFFLDPWNL